MSDEKMTFSCPPPNKDYELCAPGWMEAWASFTDISILFEMRSEIDNSYTRFVTAHQLKELAIWLNTVADEWEKKYEQSRSRNDKTEIGDNH
jgi:hypothetical protein